MKKMVENTHLCVDLKTITREVMKQNKLVKGTLVMEEQDERFRFEEQVEQVVKHPELQWHLLDRTKHGKASVNSRHVKVEFYIHHDEYSTPAELADMLASEIETMGDNLCNINLQQEVAKCC